MKKDAKLDIGPNVKNTGEEGFLPEFEDCFWTYDEEGCDWSNRPTPFRKLHKKEEAKGKKGKRKMTETRRTMTENDQES